MLQTQPRDRGGDSSRLVSVKRADLAVCDRAVRAIARTHVAHQHEGGGAMRKAFADIRAARFLADRMQLELGENSLGAKVLGRRRRADFDPVGMLTFRHFEQSSFATAQPESRPPK